MASGFFRFDVLLLIRRFPLIFAIGDKPEQRGELATVKSMSVAAPMLSESDVAVKWTFSDAGCELYRVPENSTVVTNINALLGEAVTEVMRWEENEWKMFESAGPDVEKNDTRVISLGIILGIDKTLLPAIDIEIGKGLWSSRSIPNGTIGG